MKVSGATCWLNKRKLEQANSPPVRLDRTVAAVRNYSPLKKESQDGPGLVGESRNWKLRISSQPAPFETLSTPVASPGSNLRSISVSILGRAVC
jgi:hypothetical protein